MNTSLKDWTIAYVKHKDSAFKKLVNYTEGKEYIDFKFKDKTNRHFILERIDAEVLTKIKDCDHKTVVCLNTEENYQFLIKEWKKLASIKNLMLIFVNLKTGDKWLINPHVHAMIADPESLETGLRTMYDTANGKVAEIKAPKRAPKLFDDDVADEEEGDE